MLLDWFKNNGLCANPEKFHLLLSEKECNVSININGSVVNNSESQKLLGIQIDSKLSFDNHISSICSKASQKLHALARVSNFMTVQQRKTILNSFILSQFGYCPLVWMFCSRNLNNKINRIHCRALRMIYNDENASFENLLLRDKSFSIH